MIKNEIIVETPEEVAELLEDSTNVTREVIIKSTSQYMSDIISGGAGRTPEFRVLGRTFQWKYADEWTWKTLIEFDEYGSEAPPPGDPAVLGVYIPQPDFVMYEGQVFQLSAIVDAIYGADTAVLWQTSDPNVATITSAGLVVATGAGPVTFTATSVFDNTKSDSVTATVSATGTGGGGSDTEAPNIADPVISVSALTGTSVTLGVSRAADNATLQGNLQYSLYRSSNDDINTLSQIDSNGTLVDGPEADKISFDVTGLTELTQYYFNVVVEDAAGNRAIYARASITTTEEPGVEPPSEFVDVHQGQFRLMGEPFRFNGTNAYYLQNYQKAGGYPADAAFVDRYIAAFSEAEITVVRMWGFYDGYDISSSWSSVDPRENVIQTAPGVYSEEALVDLDEVIAKLKAAGIKVIMPFINYWGQLGGVGQYNWWAGYETDTGTDWANRMSIFINGAQQQLWFRNYISMLLNRVNTVTGIAYKDEPAILGWEVINEARNPTNVSDPGIIRDWYQDIAQYIKSIDTNHLVGTGEEGFDHNTPIEYTAADYPNTYVLRANEGTSYIMNTAIPEIDFGRAHWYPNEYGIGTIVNDRFITAQRAYILDHHNIAQSYGKPFYVGEYGLPVWTSDAEQRKLQMYQSLWSLIETEGVAGSLIWQLTADYHKAYEFGGNIHWPGGNEEAELFMGYLNHSKVMNGTPATSLPTVPNKALTVASFTNNDITVQFLPGSDTDFPQGLTYELYVSYSSSMSTPAQVRANGELKASVVVRSENTDPVQLTATGLAQDTVHYVNVLAVDTAGNATSYNQVSQQTEYGDQIPPTLPVDKSITVLDESGSVFTVQVGAATDDVTAQANIRYELWYSTTDNLGSSLSSIMANGTLAEARVGTPTLSAVGLTADRDYYLRVLAFDEQNNFGIYDAAHLKTSPLSVYTLDTNQSFVNGLLTYLNFHEGYGNVVHDIADPLGQRVATIEGAGGRWDVVDGKKVWVKRTNYSEWISIPHRDELSFQAGSMTIALEVAFSHIDGDLYWLLYKGHNPGLSFRFPGWNNSLQIGIGDTVLSTMAHGAIKGDMDSLHFLIFTLDSPAGTGRLYLDGTLIETFDYSAQGSSPTINWDISLPIPDSDPGYSVIYHKCAIWNRELSAAEIASWSADRDVFLIETPGLTINPDAPVISDRDLIVRYTGDTFLNVEYVPAVDAVTPQASLEYEMYVSTQADLHIDWDTVKTNGTLVGSGVGGTILYASGLQPETQYYINVLVRDAEGNEAIYKQQAVTTVATTVPDRRHRIMPLGDYNTGLSAFRNALWNLLVNDAGYAGNEEIIFVGSQYWTPPADSPAHEGVDGVRIANISSKINRLLAQYRPGYVTLMVGTEDIVWGFGGETPQQKADRLNAVISQMQRNARAGTHFLVASIPPTTSSVYGGIDRADFVNDFNIALEAHIQTRIGLGEDISWIPNWAALDPALHLEADGVDLNPAGLVTQAETFYPVLASVLPDPVPVVPADTDPPVIANKASLQMQSRTTNSITFTFEKATDNVSNQNALRYRLYTNWPSLASIATAQNAIDNGTLMDSGVDVTTLTASGLPTGSTYAFQVVVLDEADNINAFTSLNASTLAQAATPPTVGTPALTIASTTIDTITVSWTKATDSQDAQSQLVYELYSSAADNIDTVADMKANGTLQATGTDVAQLVADNVGQAGSQRYLNVLVRNTGGEEAAYEAVLGQTAPDTVVPTLSSGVLTMNAKTTTSITVGFARGTDNITPQELLDYELYISTSDNISSVSSALANGTLAATGTNVIQLAATGLTPSTDYYLNVLVKDQGDNRTAYDRIQVQTEVAPDQNPPTLSSSALSIVGSPTVDTIVVSFTKATDDVTPVANLVYELYTSLSNNITTLANVLANGTLEASGTDVNQLSATGLQDSTNYYLNVLVKDETGNAVVYTPAQAQTALPPDVTPPTVSNGVLSVVGSPTPTSIEVSFAKASDDRSNQTALVYELYTSLANNLATPGDMTTNGTLAATGTDVAALEATGLTEDTTYYLNVLVRDEAGNESAYTVVQQATPLSPDTTAPTVSNGTLSTGTPTHEAITVTFAKATDDRSAQTALVYELYTSLSNNITSVADMKTNGTLANSGTDVAELTVGGLTAETFYYLNVLVRDEAGNESAYTSVLEETDVAPSAGPEIDDTNPLSTDLALYLNFHEGQGSVIQDLSGNGNNATAMGDGGVWDTVDGEQVWRKREANLEWLVVADSPTINFGTAQSLTFAVRCSFDDANSAWNSIIFKGYNPGYAIEYPGWTSEIKPSAGTQNFTLVPGIKGLMTTLHTLVVRVNNSNLTFDLFIDGVSIHSQALPAAQNITNANDLFFLGTGGVAGIIGIMAKAAIWGRALSDQEIADWHANPDSILKP